MSKQETGFLFEFRANLTILKRCTLKNSMIAINTHYK